MMMMIRCWFFCAALTLSGTTSFTLVPRAARFQARNPHAVRDEKSGSPHLFMATWSDSKAVRDYQDFLNSGKQEIDVARDGPSVIIKPGTTQGGSSELADALVAMGMGDDLVLTPEQELPDAMGGSSEYPVYVTLPPSQIEDFLINLKDSYRARPEDFVFFSGGLQYGNIEGVLQDRGTTKGGPQFQSSHCCFQIFTYSLLWFSFSFLHQATAVIP